MRAYIKEHCQIFVYICNMSSGCQFFFCVWGTNSHRVFIGAAWNLKLYDDYDYTTSTPLWILSPV